MSMKPLILVFGIEAADPNAFFGGDSPSHHDCKRQPSDRRSTIAPGNRRTGKRYIAAGTAASPMRDIVIQQDL